MQRTANDVGLDLLFERVERVSAHRRTSSQSWAEAWQEARRWYLGAALLAVVTLLVAVLANG